MLADTDTMAPRTGHEGTSAGAAARLHVGLTPSGDRHCGLWRSHLGCDAAAGLYQSCSYKIQEGKGRFALQQVERNRSGRAGSGDCPMKHGASPHAQTGEPFCL